MQAIILAAGLGRRLRELTADNTKSMVKVNGIRLIDRMLSQLADLQLSRIIIVIGYRGENLRQHVANTFPALNIVFVENSVYDRTNNIYSLWLARELMAEDDTLLLESDLIFKPEVIRSIIDSRFKDCALVSKYDTWMDGTMVTIDADDNIVNFIPKKAFDFADTDQYYKTVNIYRFSKSFSVNHYLPFLEAYIRVLGQNEYYEQVLRVITLIDGIEFKAVKVDGQSWYEIDDVQDLRIAETIFASPEERLRMLQTANGGYWRYPWLVDLATPGNPFFPSARMLNELRSPFDTLITSSPSSDIITSLLASKCLDIKHNYVAVANNLSELCTVLEVQGECCYQGNVCYSGNGSVRTELLSKIKSLPPAKLCIVNETGCEFVDNYKSLIDNDILESYPNLIVIRSLSEEYGVSGLGIHAVVCANTKLISVLRQSLGAKNLNSIAEFFLQIVSKYENDYKRSIQHLRHEHQWLEQHLCATTILKPLPQSQFNTIYCETHGISSHDLTLRLLNDHNILVHNDISTDTIRISVGKHDANVQLLNSLATIQSQLS